MKDLIILGTGPAGYSAAIYASRYKINFELIGKISGGLISTAHKICNYPGFEKINGIELTEKMKSHAESLGVNEINDEIVSIKHENKSFQLKSSTGKVYKSRFLLLATGTKRRKLNLSREQEFLGKGVSYCATCDGGFFRDKTVAVVGGSDAANTASLYLSDIAKKVYQIYRRDILRGDPTWAESVMNNEKIEVIYDANVIELIGDNRLTRIKLDNGDKLPVDGLFIEIGSVPDKKLFSSLKLQLNDRGYIKINEKQQTNISGLWAAGDVTTGSNGFRQAVTAASEGAIATENIYHKILEAKN